MPGALVNKPPKSHFEQIVQTPVIPFSYPSTLSQHAIDQLEFKKRQANERSAKVVRREAKGDLAEFRGAKHSKQRGAEVYPLRSEHSKVNNRLGDEGDLVFRPLYRREGAVGKDVPMNGSYMALPPIPPARKEVDFWDIARVSKPRRKLKMNTTPGGQKPRATVPSAGAQFVGVTESYISEFMLDSAYEESWERPEPSEISFAMFSVGSEADADERSERDESEYDWEEVAA